jgi:hypothetical protein
MPRFAVIRPSADLPEGFLPEHLDGKWVELGDASDIQYGDWGGNSLVAVPTGRHETRDDGERAEVFEVRE